jgi:hypothetical protein
MLPIGNKGADYGLCAAGDVLGVLFAVQVGTE